MYKQSLVSVVTEFLVDILFYGGILCVLTIPFLVPRFNQDYLHIPTSILTPFIFVLMTSGICAIYILFELKMIFMTLMEGNPFVVENVQTLRKIAVASFIVALIYLVKCLFWFTIATFLIVIVFFLASLFCLTLKDVFKQAVLYKEENDWTV